ncbi:MAG: T9SS type A sorting domain-containing protein [Bacteroidales bacterium]
MLNLVLLFPICCLGQMTTWDKTYDLNQQDYGTGIVEAFDGGFVLTGYTGGDDWPNLLIMKLASNGDTVWTKVYADEGHSKGNRIIQTSDSGYIIAGFTCENEFYFDYRMFILKINQTGDTIWTKKHDESNMSAGSIVKTFDGNYVIAGGPGPGSNAKTILLKLNENGELIWEKTYVFEDSATPDGLHFLEQTADSGFIMSGSKSEGFNLSDVWLMRLNKDGDTLWTKLYGDPLVHDFGTYAIQADTSGYILTTIRDIPNYQNNYLVIIKLDNNGNFLWEKIYGGNAIQGISHLKKTINNDFVGTGYFGSSNGNRELYIVRFNNYGDTIWTRAYPQNARSYGNDIIQLSDIGFIVSGGSSNGNSFYEDIRVLKLDEMGLVTSAESKETTNRNLLRNYPNPFQDYTTIEISPGIGHVCLTIYNSQGLLIKEVDLSDTNHYKTTFQFDSRDIPLGIYYCCLKTVKGIQSIKMIKTH